MNTRIAAFARRLGNVNRRLPLSANDRPIMAGHSRPAMIARVHRDVYNGPRSHGPVIARVMPGVWILTNKVRANGSQHAPQNSVSR